MDVSAVNLKAKSGSHGVPTLDSGGSGVDIQKIPRLIIHNFEDMGVAADKDVGPVLPDEGAGFGIVVAGRAADMGHQDFQSLAHPAQRKGILMDQATVVAVSDDAPEGLESRNLIRRIQPAAEVAGMPDLVHGSEEIPELGREEPVGI